MSSTQEFPEVNILLEKLRSKNVNAIWNESVELLEEFKIKFSKYFESYLLQIANLIRAKHFVEPVFKNNLDEYILTIAQMTSSEKHFDKSRDANKTDEKFMQYLYRVCQCLKSSYIIDVFLPSFYQYFISDSNAKDFYTLLEYIQAKFADDEYCQSFLLNSIIVFIECDTIFINSLFEKFSRKISKRQGEVVSDFFDSFIKSMPMMRKYQFQAFELFYKNYCDETSLNVLFQTLSKSLFKTWDYSEFSTAFCNFDSKIFTINNVQKPKLERKSEISVDLDFSAQIGKFRSDYDSSPKYHRTEFNISDFCRKCFCFYVSKYDLILMDIINKQKEGFEQEIQSIPQNYQYSMKYYYANYSIINAASSEEKKNEEKDAETIEAEVAYKNLKMKFQGKLNQMISNIPRDSSGKPTKVTLKTLQLINKSYERMEKEYQELKKKYFIFPILEQQKIAIEREWFDFTTYTLYKYEKTTEKLNFTYSDNKPIGDYIKLHLKEHIKSMVDSRVRVLKSTVFKTSFLGKDFATEEIKKLKLFTLTSDSIDGAFVNLVSGTQKYIINDAKATSHVLSSIYNMITIPQIFVMIDNIIIPKETKFQGSIDKDSKSLFERMAKKIIEEEANTSKVYFGMKIKIFCNIINERKHMIAGKREQTKPNSRKKPQGVMYQILDAVDQILNNPNSQRETPANYCSYSLLKPWKDAIESSPDFDFC
ncbi:hypothetical protein TVAG_498580 [Trichomonas vaginalis G3]|uniref:Uncharacterized protein n=1 Tax=Trichomonas vaginalis (strain ATCC PRA-98 / G3) TaxID=412133 RepID=A2E846_TRIV3|nr:hypothetical protein TVAG_498580 [Trichomonas vaginalis G3]|eukprot:XP_001323387.1 hypothetical protein [Trichomonas vaginalis G3]